jgi:predicted DNA-binding helix-hairpin-helix protein
LNFFPVDENISPTKTIPHVPGIPVSIQSELFAFPF